MAKKVRHVPPGVKSLGEAIRLLRTEQRMTLRALADAAGVSAPFLSDLEHGRRQTNELDAIAAALHVPAKELQQFDGRVSAPLKDWLAENPQLLSILKDLQASGAPIPLEALRAAARRGKK